MKYGWTYEKIAENKGCSKAKVSMAIDKAIDCGYLISRDRPKAKWMQLIQDTKVSDVLQAE